MQFVEIHTEEANRLPFALCTMGEYPKQPNVFRKNGLPFHEFLWLKSGSADFRVKDEHFVLHAGEGIFLRAGVPHSYEGEDFHTAWCTFTLQGALLDHFGVGEYLCFSVPTYLESEAEQLLRFVTGESTLLSRSAAGYSFVVELFSAILSPKDSLSVRVLRYLEQHYAEQLSLDEIAGVFFVDRYTLCRTYKRERGVTVIEDLQRLRVSKAKRFLKYGADPIERVGKMCGFESASYFGKRFREAIGMTPLEYRKNKS